MLMTEAMVGSRRFLAGRRRISRPRQGEIFFSEADIAKSARRF